LIVDGEIVVNGVDEFFDGIEAAPSYRLVGDFGEEPLHQIEPRARGGHEVHLKSRMLLQPSSYVRMFVGSVVIENDVQIQVLRSLGVDLFQKAQELRVLVSLLARANHLSGEHVQSREESGGTVSLVVVGYRLAASLLHRQSRLGAVQSLDLGLLVHAKNQRLLGRIHIESDHVDQLLFEVGIRAELELFDLMRLQTRSGPNPLNARFTDSRRFSHSTGAPMSSPVGLGESGDGQNRFHHILGNRSWATGSRSVAFHSFDALLQEPLLPTGDHLPIDAEFRRRSDHRRPRIEFQNDLISKN
jgi:hypothetical protein